MNYLGNDTSENENFVNKKFVITGALQMFGREELKEFIELCGGKVSGSVSKKTDCVIVGDNPGSEYEKAKELNITIWDENKLMEMIK